MELEEEVEFAAVAVVVAIGIDSVVEEDGGGVMRANDGVATGVDVAGVSLTVVCVVCGLVGIVWRTTRRMGEMDGNGVGVSGDEEDAVGSDMVERLYTRMDIWLSVVLAVDRVSRVESSWARIGSWVVGAARNAVEKR